MPPCTLSRFQFGCTRGHTVQGYKGAYRSGVEGIDSGQSGGGHEVLQPLPRLLQHIRQPHQGLHRNAALLHPPHKRNAPVHSSKPMYSSTPMYSQFAHDFARCPLPLASTCRSPVTGLTGAAAPREPCHKHGAWESTPYGHCRSKQCWISLEVAPWQSHAGGARSLHSWREKKSGRGDAIRTLRP